MLYRVPLRLLGDLMSTKALERLFTDGARSRHTDLEGLNRDQIEEILKREVFRRLQLSVPAPLAKRRVQEVLDALTSEPAVNEGGLEDRATLDSLEASVRRFALYFDWPESQRLRALITVVRGELEQNRRPVQLLQEGLDLVGALDRRLQEGLVGQASDLAELKADLNRFSAVGGPKVRRLESLLRQVEEAQTQGTLLPGEVERARKLTLDLRKLVESSVITRTSHGELTPAEDAPVLVDLNLLPQDARERLTGAERESQARELADLARQYDDVTRLRPDLREQVQALRARFEGGELVAEGIVGLREILAGTREEALRAQGLELDALQARLDVLGAAAPEATGLALRVARGTLEGGALITEALSELSATIATLEQQDAGSAAKLLALQHETFELERAARDLPGALEELAAPLQAARDALAAGQLPDLAPLWAVLERRMAQAAQQREGLDARADKVITDYDVYRHLAGETIQRLGRLADTLRAQRRLGALSSDAREKYGQTLEQAEALLDEARAEFEAAREVTSAFGVDALAGLLDVFGDEDLPLLAPAPEDTPSGLPAGDLRAALDALAAGEHARIWLLRGGEALYGPPEAHAARLTDLLTAAGSDTELLSVEGAGAAWLALRLGGSALLLETVPEALPEWRGRLLAEAPELRALLP